MFNKMTHSALSLFLGLMVAVSSLAGCAITRASGASGYDPQTYGGKPGDSTDDTAALAAAMTAAAAAGGGEVRLSAGTWRYTRLPIKTLVRLVGAGRTNTVLLCTDSSSVDSGMTFGSSFRRADDNAGVYYAGFENLTIATAVSNVVAAQAANANVIGVNLAGCAYTFMQNVSVSGFGYAGLVLARAENGAEGLGFTGTALDGNYNTFVGLQILGNGAHNTTKATGHKVDGDTTATSPTITGMSAADVLLCRIGDSITGTGIPANTTVIGIPSTTSLTLSNNATATGSAVTLTTSSLITPNVWLKYKANSNKFYGVYTLGGIPNAQGAGDTTNGSKTITSVSAPDIAELVVGRFVKGTGIPVAAQVESIGATSFDISIPATATGSMVDLYTYGSTTGIAVQYGNDNLFSGGTWESISRGIWFGLNSFDNSVHQFRAEGIFDSVLKTTARTDVNVGGSGNMVFGLHHSSGGYVTDLGDDSYLQLMANSKHLFRSGPYQSTNGTITSDYHYIDAHGVLASAEDGLFRIKAPGFNAAATPTDNAAKFQFQNTISAQVADGVLGEVRAWNADSSLSASGANAIMRMKSFDAVGRSGFEFLTGTGDAPTEKLEIDQGVTVASGITFTTRGARVLKARIDTGASQTLADTEELLLCNYVGAEAVTVAGSPTLGRIVTIKDMRGDGAAFPIVIDPDSGSIDAASTYTIDGNYGSVTLIGNGTDWNGI